MAKRLSKRRHRTTLLGRELLDFCDDITAYNAATHFLLWALVTNLEEEHAVNSR